MATTFVEYTGDGNATKQFTFPSYQQADIKVTVDGVAKTAGSHFNITSYTTTGGGNVVFTSGNIPSSPALIRIFRDTDVDSAKATFTAGSSVKAADLNNNITQLLYAAQEEQNQLEQTADIRDDAVTTAKIKDANVTTAKIADDAVTADKLANSINTEIANNTAKVTNATHTGDVTGATSLTIAQDAVTTSKIAADAVVGAKIADNAIDSEHYTDGSIDTEHIANDAVTAAKLADTSVTAGTYNTANITVDAQGRITAAAAGNANITDGQITTAKIADDAVTTDKLANSIVSDITANNAKVTNVTTNLTTTTATGSVTINSSDGTNATIGEATSSAAGVMSTAHHDKLDGIEAGATGDQTNAEIRAAVEAASDSNVFTDADHSKLNAIEANATADQTASEIKTLLQSDKLTASEIATGALDGRYYTEAESDARYFNVSSGDTITSGDTFPDNDNTIATTKAINARIIDLVDDVGGFVPIASETAFPSTNPDVNNGSGTLVSIKAIGSTRTPSGGTVTISNGAGSSTVTITGCGSTVLTAGFGVIVETTSTLHTYAFHRLVPKATEVTTVAANATNIAAAGANTSNINSVASNASNINTVAGISSNVTTVAGVASNVTTVAGISSDVTAVANDATDIGVVAGKATEIGRLGTADAVADMNTLGTTAIVSDMDTLADISSNITTVANNSSNVTTVAGISGNVTTVAGNNANITTVAGANSNISTVASSIANVNTAASNISNVNSFANTYQIASSNPSTDGGGNSLAAGDLYFNTSSNELRVYNGSSWQGGVTATGNLAGLGANTFTGLQTLNAGLLVTGSQEAQITLQDSDTTGTGSEIGIKFKDSGGTEIGEIGFISPSNNNLYVDSSGSGKIIIRPNGNQERLEVDGNGITVTGNITLATSNATVDGVDVSALNSTVAGITSNATHTGEVTGSGALTIADNVVDEANLKVSNSPTNGYFLQAQSGNTGGLTWAQVDLSSKFNTTGGTISGNVSVNGDLKVLDDKVVGAGDDFDIYLYKDPSGDTYLRGLNSAMNINTLHNYSMKFRTNTTGTNAGWDIETDGDFVPSGHKTVDIGSSSKYVDQAYLADVNCENIAITSHIYVAGNSNIGTSSTPGNNIYFDHFYGDGSNLTGIATGVTSDSQYNTVAGTNAGDSFSGTNAEQNTLFGYNAGTAITTADYNTAIGAFALNAAETATECTAVGRLSQFTATSGSFNTSVGHKTLYLNTGAQNTAVGADAGSTMANADYNTAVGSAALQYCTTGSYNTAIGARAYRNGTTGQYNIAVGMYAMAGSAVTGNYNIGIGDTTLEDLTSGAYNIAIGSEAGKEITSGQNNTAVGYQALFKSTTSAGNTAVGKGALGYQTGTRNTAIGFHAGYGANGSSGTDNTIMGYSAAPALTSGSQNVITGMESCESLTTATGNVCVGVQSAKTITSGTNNVIVGHRAANSNTNNITSGSNNIVLGYLAQLTSATVSNEITLGNSSITKFRVPGVSLEADDGILSLKTGSGNSSAIRFYCESSNAHYVNLRAPAHSAFSGNPDFVLPPNEGTNGYFLKTDGSGNTSWAQVNTDLVNDTSPQLGANLDVNGANILFGDSSSAGTNLNRLKFGVGTDLHIWHNSGTGNSNISAYSGDLYIQGNDGSGTGVNQIAIKSNAGVELNYQGTTKFETSSSGVSVTGDMTASGNVTAYSDAKLKNEVTTINDALGIVGKLRGVSYKWLSNGQSDIGVIAQEVETVVPEVVKETEEGIKTVDYGRLVSVLINAINELKAEVDELKGGK